jgi:hypothetical protein
MNFESLPNELLFELFEYLSVTDRFRAFIGLNDRFDTLLFKPFHEYCLDFRSLSKRDFDFVCQRYLPSIIDRVCSIYLSDDDETPDQINCFLLYNQTLRGFTNLQSLSIHYLRSEVVMYSLLREFDHFHNLIRLSFTKCEFKHDDNTIFQLLSKIWAMPKLIHCYLDIKFDKRRKYSHMILRNISTSLQYLTIENMGGGHMDLDHLFEYTPNLRYFNVNVFDCTNITPLYSTMTSIVKLKIYACESSFLLIELLKKVPNLRHLTAKIDNIGMNGHQWEEIIVNHLPKLEIFQLRMIFYLEADVDKEQQVDLLLKSFRCQFWLEERRWFVRCDWNRCQKTCCYNRMHLYTLPYAFNYYYFHDSTIKQKSTCSEDDSSPLYDQVRTLHYEIFPSENRISSRFTFPNIHRLNFWLPFDDNFSSIVPQYNYLKILSVGLDSVNYSLDRVHQLQTILDQAPSLYALEFFGSSSPSVELPPFALSSRSIRQLCFQEIDEFYGIQQCITLSHSPLGRQCEVLSISVKNETNIFVLLNRMPNLRALSVIIEDDPWDDDDNDDDLLDLLKYRLRSTYTITRSSDAITKRIFLKSFYPIRLWFSKP